MLPLPIARATIRLNIIRNTKNHGNPSQLRHYDVPHRKLRLLQGIAMAHVLLQFPTDYRAESCAVSRIPTPMWAGNRDRNFFSQLSYRTQIPFGKHQPSSENQHSIGIRAILKYANDFLHYRSDYPENISVHANNRYHQQDVYAALSASYQIRDFGFSASSDLRWSDLTTDVKNFHYVYRLDSKSSLSAFYQHGGLKASVSGLYTHLADHTQGKAKPLHKMTWNALASYTLGDWTLRSFYKTVFRAPTLNDLYYTMVGNRNLKPEYTKQVDVGITFSKPFVDAGRLVLQPGGRPHRLFAAEGFVSVDDAQLWLHPLHGCGCERECALSPAFSAPYGHVSG